jgi:predicted GNAT superfamily acetyltransferase
MVEISIREPYEKEDMNRFVELMDSSFELQDRVSVLPRHVFIALRNTGCLLGAYIEDSLVGFICWWPDPTAERSIYSHAIAVDRKHRGKNIGEKLLFAMQDSAENDGYRSVWGTFDPLKSYLAQLYVTKFGVTVSEYRNDYYGELSAEELSGETPTDRFVAVKHFRTEKAQEHELTSETPRVLRVEEDGVSIDVEKSVVTPTKEGGEDRWAIEEDIYEDVLGVEVPRNFVRVRDAHTETDWRFATRRVFTKLLKDNGGNYVVTDFLHEETEEVNDCTYVLVKCKE